MRKGARYSYVLQESWENGPWEDHIENDKLEPTKKSYQERISNPIWHGEGRRKWRMVRRYTLDTEIVL